MISSETRMQIRHCFFAEHWKIGTIAKELGIHPDAVRSAIESNHFHRAQTLRACITDPYLPSIRQTLDQYPQLRATRIYQMRGHVHAFQAWSGQPRVILHDNLRSAVLERRGNQIHFHPRLLEMCAHYHCVARPCQVRAGNQKGRVERAIRYVRESFWAGRDFTTLEECNRQALRWRDEVAHQRPWPGDDSRTVAQAFAEEQPRLLPLPLHPFHTDLVVPIRSAKTIYVRFDLNDCSIPPDAVRRPLTLVASDTWVRILEGNQVIACHRRSYDRHQPVLDPDHQQALLKQKRKAFHSTPTGRLAQAVPESETLLDLAFARGESAGSQTAQLRKLLDIYGAPERALTLDFLQEARNLVLVGRNGLGKTMIAQNICHAAVLAGSSVLFRSTGAVGRTPASEPGGPPSQASCLRQRGLVVHRLMCSCQ